jgi:ABC-type uncharacterized transport system involved in gliding motility auxiliary subunit
VLAVAVEGRLPGADSGGAPLPAVGSETRPFRVVIAGDGDFASNSFFPYMSNSDLALAMIRWLLREDRSPAIRPAIAVPPLVLLTRNQMRGIFLGVEVLLPLAAVVIGAVVWWKRR